MIKFNELKQGDYVLAESDGQAWQGEVTDFNNDEKEIAVNNGVQEFYFKSEELYPIPVDEDQTPSQDNFSNYEIWYREEKRIIAEPIYLHQLQNHYLAMTKVHLTDKAI